MTRRADLTPVQLLMRADEDAHAAREAVRDGRMPDASIYRAWEYELRVDAYAVLWRTVGIDAPRELHQLRRFR